MYATSSKPSPSRSATTAVFVGSSPMFGVGLGQPGASVPSKRSACSAVGADARESLENTASARPSPSTSASAAAPPPKKASASWDDVEIDTGQPGSWEPFARNALV